jgi:hypothetical protein
VPDRQQWAEMTAALAAAHLAVEQSHATTGAGPARRGCRRYGLVQNQVRPNRTSSGNSLIL